MSTLPDPELYIIVDGRPIKGKVVWQNIVDVDNVRHAVDKLRETNWLYRTVDDDSVDKATKKTIEVVSIASNPILKRGHQWMISMVYRLTPFIRWISTCRPAETLNTTNYLV